MAFVNSYTPEEYMVSFDVADGDHILNCTGANEKMSQSGKQMLEVYFTCDASAGTYTERFVEGDYFNRNVTKLFDCLGLERGDFAYSHWVGHKCVGHFEHKEETYVDRQTGMTKTANRCVMKYLVLPTKEEKGNTIPNGVQKEPTIF